jgi:hypothetical protein
MIRKMFSLVVCAITLSVMVPAVAMADSSVVVFGKTGALLDSVSYSVSYSGPVNHTVFDLEIGTGTYNIYQGGVLQGAIPVSSENTIVFDDFYSWHNLCHKLYRR